MNLCIITGRIIRKPKVYYVNNQHYISLILYVKNNHNYNNNAYNLLFAYYNINSFSYLTYLYKQNKDTIFEGYLYKPKICMKENTVIQNSFKQYLWIKLYKIYG